QRVGAPSREPAHARRAGGGSAGGGGGRAAAKPAELLKPGRRKTVTPRPWIPRPAENQARSGARRDSAGWGYLAWITSYRGFPDSGCSSRPAYSFLGPV